LDPISEERVFFRVKEHCQGKTIVFFTQRIQLATRADRIFYMEQGQIVEAGSHKQLIAKKGKYFEFYCNHLSMG
jgi:ABC-type multidrug transport system fused ATPase/permease subunit